MAFVPQPGNMDFKTWANQVILSFPNFPIQQPISEEKWADWVRQLMQIPQLGTIPQPIITQKTNNIPDWKIWSNYFINSVANL